MLSILPYDIIAQIINTVGKDKDTNLLKELSLVSHSFHQICCKHLFATVELHDADADTDLNPHVASSKKGFLKLLKSRPDVVKYIRKLTYEVSYYYDDDLRLSRILPKFLRTISGLNCLKIAASQLDWNELGSSLTSAFLYLMHLPTINHIDLSFIYNFPLSSLTLSVNLLRLDIYFVGRLKEEIVVHSEMMPKIREFRTSGSTLLTTKLLHAKRQDGRPAFNFMDLRQLSMSFLWYEDEQNIRYLLQNAKLLENIHLLFGLHQSLVGLHDIFSPSARTLKVLDLTASLPLEGLCEELEAMTGNNMLEALSLEFNVDDDDDEDFIGYTIQNVEKVLVKPGWSALRRVSFKLTIRGNSAGLYEALQSLPDKYLSQLSKLESVAFNFTDLRRLSICLGDERNIRYLLQNAKLLEKLYLSPFTFDESLDRLHDILSPSAGTLKVLDLTLLLYEKSDGTINLPFEGLCEELEAMTGHYVLEALSLEVKLFRYEKTDDIGSMFQSVEKVLVNPGWSSLRQVSFKVPIRCWLVKDSAELAEELQSLLPDKYLNRLSKLESVAFNFSSYVF